MPVTTRKARKNMRRRESSTTPPPLTDHAAEHQAAADYHGDLGEHDGSLGIADDSSHVDSGGAYDSTATDYSSHDTSTDTSTE